MKVILSALDQVIKKTPVVVHASFLHEPSAVGCFFYTLIAASGLSIFNFRVERFGR